MLQKLTLLALGCAWANAYPQPPALQQARQDVAVLTSDSLAGRGYQDQGHRRAAAYIARRLQQAGLQLRGTPQPGGLPWQEFSFKVHRTHAASLSLGKKPLRPGYDFLPGAGAPAASGTWPLTDGGYGLSLGPEVSGAWVTLRRNLPPDDPQLKALPDSVRRALNQPFTRLQLAKAAGAAGVLFVSDKLTYSYAQQQAPLPYMEVLTTSLKKGKRLNLTLNAGWDTLTSQNVVALLPGRRVLQGEVTASKDSLVVVCAHYDHLGRLGPALFAGANDNASGIALLLALADSLGRLGPDQRPRHSTLFIAFGAEETGLNGSQHYVATAPRAMLARIKMVFNYDLTGFGEKGLMVVGGKEHPAVATAAQALGARQQPPLSPVLTRPNAPNSDHFPFTQVGVPAVFLYTQGGPGFYHDVLDRPETLNWDYWLSLRHLAVGLVRLWAD